MPSAVPICPSCRAIPPWVRLEVGIRGGRATVRIVSRPIISVDITCPDASYQRGSRQSKPDPLSPLDIFLFSQTTSLSPLIGGVPCILGMIPVASRLTKSRSLTLPRRGNASEKRSGKKAAPPAFSSAARPAAQVTCSLSPTIADVGAFKITPTGFPGTCSLPNPIRRTAATCPLAGRRYVPCESRLRGCFSGGRPGCWDRTRRRKGPLGPSRR